ncbi:L-cysteine desulfhydrase [Glycine soja]
MSSTTIHENNHHNNSDIPKKPKLSSTFITPSEIEFEFGHHEVVVACINYNNFSCCPTSILAGQRHWQLQYLRQPDHSYFNDLQSSILQSRTLIKDLVNANHVNEISIIGNATIVAAIVLQHTAWNFRERKFQKGDIVLMARPDGRKALVKLDMPKQWSINDYVLKAVSWHLAKSTLSFYPEIFKIDAVNATSGSAYAEVGNTKGSDHKEYSSMLHKALEEAIILETFPKTTLDIHALVLESIGRFHFMDSDSWISTRLSSSSRRHHYRSDLYAEESEGNDDFRAEFLCPFCAEDYDVVSLCCHIDDHHPIQAKNGVCPICGKKVGVDLVGHFTTQHGNFLRISFLQVGLFLMLLLLVFLFLSTSVI